MTKADIDAWCINILREVQRLNFTPPGETSTEQIVREGKRTDLMTTLNVNRGVYQAALTKDCEDCEEMLRTTQYKAKGGRGMVEMKRASNIGVWRSPSSRHRPSAHWRIQRP